MDIFDIAIARQLGGGGSGGEAGPDGFSPVVTVTDITGGHRISIQDKTKTNTFDVMDGVNGGTGATGNGISSVVLNSDYTLTINFTNGTSTTTTSIRGESGRDADPTTIIDDTTASANKVYSSSKINTELSGKVSSSFVSNIWKGTQLEYDAITTKDNTTLYFITEE